MASLLGVLLVCAPGFTNVADEVGLAGPASGRAVFADLDADGRLDVVLNRQHVFLQRDDGRFEEIGGLGLVPDLVLFADFDNDGRPDCFAGAYCEPEKEDWKDHGRSNVLLLNRPGEDGRPVWKQVPLAMPRTTVAAACTCDYDRDGVLDLYVGSWYRRYGASLACYPDRLYRGKGDGTFEDVTERVGLLTADEPGRRDSSRPTYGLTHGDFDGDGWTDLWVCTYGRQWNFLWRNAGGERFEDIAAKTGFDGDADRSGTYPDWTKAFWKERFGHEREDEPPFRANGNTFDCAIADFDNDGDFDCILAEITHAWAGPSSDRTSLLVNEDGRFRRLPEAFAREHATGRWNQGDIHCGWIDFDNDMRLDALVASSDYPDRQELKLYRQREDATFEPARTFDWEGAAQLSVGDVDNDGDLDILVGRSLNRLPKERREALGPSCALFRNDLANGNHWLQVVCRGGAGANRDGIGCIVRVTTPDGTTQTREIRGGRGHAGHNDPYVAHFGLAGHEEARVEVWWPNRRGTTTVRETVRADQRVTIEP